MTKNRRLVKIWVNWLKMAKIAFLSYMCEIEKKMSIFESSYVIGIKSKKVLSYRRETEKKCQFWKQLCGLSQNLGSWWKFEPNWLKMAKIAFWVTGVKQRKKCQIMKAAMGLVSKVRGLVKIYAKSVENWPKLHFWVIGVKQRKKMSILKAAMWSMSKDRRLVKIWAKLVENGQNSILS